MIWSQSAIPEVRNLWNDNKSIFYFDKEQWRGYLKMVEDDMGVERKLEDLN